MPKSMPLLDMPSLAEDLARTLAYLHDAGFAHRDVKSSNVLLAWCSVKQRIQAKLCDFGSAAPVSKMPRRPAQPQWGGLEKWLGFTGRWQPVGTMLWMAPEMLEPPVEGTEAPAGYSGDKVDVYSLGVVLWELMEWRVPWAGENDVSKQEVLDAVVRRGERLPIPSGCNSRLTDLMSMMWAQSPEQRPDARLVLAELEQIGPAWDVSGHFPRVAQAANARGEELTHVLAAATIERRAQPQMYGDPSQAVATVPGSSRTADVKGGAPAVELQRESAPAVTARRSESGEGVVVDSKVELIDGPRLTDGGQVSGVSQNSDFASDAKLTDPVATLPDVMHVSAAPTGVSEPREPGNWFGEVGSVSFDDLDQFLVPSIYPHIFASVVSAAETELLKDQYSELAVLESRAEDLRARSKLDPFAAFTADAKKREAQRLKKRLSLSAAEGEMNAWRATRDVLRKQLVEAETQHLEWRRKYREIERN